MHDPRLTHRHARVVAGALALALACGEPSPAPEGPPAATSAATNVPAGPSATSPAPDDPFARLDLGALRPGERVGWPVERPHVTSYFGWRINPITGAGTKLHRGLDLRGQIGDLALSIADGEVAFAGHDPFLGNLVIVDHGLGVASYYGHLNDVLAAVGTPVERGAAIGIIGNTGRSEAPHLHLTVKIGAVAVDPLWLIGQPLHPYPALAAIAEAPADEAP